MHKSTRKNIKIHLAEVKTKDGLLLEGAVALAKKKKVCLVFLHGLASNFYRTQHIFSEIFLLGQKHGISIASFNTRGRDVIASYKKQKRLKEKPKYINAGTAFENFKDCVLDIRAMVNFVKKLGFKKIILVGHSTGANKAIYYLYKTKDRRINGIILLGALSDTAIRKKELGKNYAQNIKLVKGFLKKNGGNALLPEKLNKGFLSARRYLSLYKDKSPEDVFPYHNAKASWRTFKKIGGRMLIILGEKDQYLDRPAKEILNAFRKKAGPKTKICLKTIPLANHSFRKREHALANAVIKWANGNIANKNNGA